MDWIETPHIELIGSNLGNRFFQYFAALTLAERLGGCTVDNAEFPEWGLRSEPRDPQRYRRLLIIKDIKEFDIAALEAACRLDPSLYIRNRNHLQRQEFYLPAAHYRRRFPIVAQDARAGRDDELLINIRAGDIASGFAAHYPLMPIDFYEDIVRLTGLRPVFVGQLAPGPYVDALRARFPAALFIPSRDPVTDFDTIRLAHNIVPAVSTFSLAAAWLSEAKTIFLPLNGFLNPAHMPDIDLLPSDDHRYRFFLFPMNYALPEQQALLHHAAMKGGWKEYSRQRLDLLRHGAPFISRFRDADAAAVPGFNERAYVHRHIDVAQDISAGWYKNGLHHYLDFGRSRGYAPDLGVAAVNEAFPNLARHAAASQSSCSPWSKGASVAADAGGAVDGDPFKEYGFHTAAEFEPWWMVDCGTPFILKEIRIYNRKGALLLQQRSAPLRVEVSETGDTWRELFCTSPGHIFGAAQDAMVPLTWRTEERLVARLVRISIPGRVEYLHLAQVEVRGIPL